MYSLEHSIELSSLDETDNKLVWSARTPNANFNLYIPKWRVPKPYPGKIGIHLTTNLSEWESYTPTLSIFISEDPTRAEKPILSKVQLKSIHSETVRYTPVEPDYFEIGDPYIPMSLLLPDPPETLLIKVRWNLSSLGQFQKRRVNKQIDKQPNSLKGKHRKFINGKEVEEK